MAKSTSSADGHCKDLLERFSAYLDGDLEHGCCQELERHLDDCMNCVGTVEGMRRMLAICQQERLSGSDVKPSADFRRKLLAAVFLAEED